MSTSSVYLCFVMLKLNSTEVVAAVRISVKRAVGIMGVINLLLYEVSTQI